MADLDPPNTGTIERAADGLGVSRGELEIDRITTITKRAVEQLDWIEVFHLEHREALGVNAINYLVDDLNSAVCVRNRHAIVNPQVNNPRPEI
jgi:hypothetical protein